MAKKPPSPYLPNQVDAPGTDIPYWTSDPTTTTLPSAIEYPFGNKPVAKTPTITDSVIQALKQTFSDNLAGPSVNPTTGQVFFDNKALPVYEQPEQLKGTGTLATPTQMQAAPKSLSYQQYVYRALKPYIDAISPTASQMATAVNPGGGTVSGTLQTQIAQSLTQQANDYKSGLSQMMAATPAANNINAILTGIKSLMEYPISMMAPPGVQSSPIAMQLFQALAEMRQDEPVTAYSAKNTNTGYGTITPSMLSG